MELTYKYELANEKEVELIITFHCEDYGWGEGFSGTHGKDEDLTYEIEFIECDDAEFSEELKDQEFYNEVRESILNDDSFFEQADAITFNNEYEEY